MDISKTRVGFYILVVAIVLGILGFREERIGSVSELEPQEMTCADLEANGPGDNAHIILSDFFVCDFAYVIVERGFRWERAYVPVIAKGGDSHKSIRKALVNRLDDVPLPSEIRVILKLPDARSEEDVEETGREESLQGTIVNVIHSLDDETQSLLEESYPVVDFTNVWILEVGLSPSSAGKMWGLFIGSALCALVGGVVALKGYREGA